MQSLALTSFQQIGDDRQYKRRAYLDGEALGSKNPTSYFTQRSI